MKMRINLFQESGTLDNRAIGAGVYIVELRRENEEQPIPLYIGRSVYMIKRSGEHLFEFNDAPEYFGLETLDLDDKKLELYFRILEFLPNATKSELREKERYHIAERNPVTQFSSSDWQIDDRLKVVKDKRAELWETNNSE